MNLINLKKAIKHNEVILFIGAGVPATLDIPNWSQLISYMAESLNYDPRIFKTYGDYLTLAEYYEIKKNGIGELRSWLDYHWNANLDKIYESKIYEYIVKLNFNIIYTTNYDHTIEEAFKYYNKKLTKIVTVNDFTKIAEGKTQLIKFHGDTISDSSIVLSEHSYFDRLNFDSPLDIKLKSDILGKSLLFIGYSLSDINIRLMLYKLDQLWKKNNEFINKPKSYIFLSSPNPIQEKIFQTRGIIPFISADIDKKKGLEQFLESLYDKE